MATSQNGWPARESAVGLAPLDWITGRVLPGDVHTVFNYFCRRFSESVEPINRGHSWGWAYRDVRGGSSLSNHASATAIDLNAPAHPLGASGTFTAPQLRALSAILSSLQGVVRWGGDYPGRKDEMHFEINATSQQVAFIAERIRLAELGPSGGGGGSTNPNPAPGTPTPPTSEEDDMTPDQSAKLDYIFNAIAPGESGVRPTGHVLEHLSRVEAEARAAKENTRPITRNGVEVSLRQEIANIGTAVTNLPTRVWAYANTVLETGDVYSILRAIRDKVVGK